MKSLKSIVAIFLFLSCLTLSASNKSIQYGKIDIADLKASICSIDSSAKAYYIFDQGETYFTYDQGFQLCYRRHLRIKILDESAIDRSIFKFAFYINTIGSEETMGAIKAQTYNLLDGKVQTTKMNKTSIVRERKDKYWDTVEFSLPNVTAGSVIDVVYSIKSVFMYKLKGWNFQYDIPVLKSNYSVEIPLYFTYKQYPYGVDFFRINQSESNGTLSFSTSTEFNFFTKVLSYSAINVPALKISEPFYVLGDNASRVEYSLIDIRFPDTWTNNILGIGEDSYERLRVPDWISVDKEYCQVFNVVDRRDGRDFLKEEAQHLIASSVDSLSLMKSSYESIKTEIEWDGTYSSYSLNSIVETMENGQGSSADINLALVALLREVNLEAYPVVLKTKIKALLE